MENTRKVLAGALIGCMALPALAQEISVEVYGGSILERDETWDGSDYPMDAGTAFGVGVYAGGLAPNLSFGLDVMSTRSLYTGYPGQYIESLSLMAVARYEAAFSDALTGYAGAGLGMIRNTYDDGPTDYSESVPGGQLSLGLRYRISPASAVFTELKYQEGFEDAEVDGVLQSYHGVSALIGYRHSF